MDITAARNRRAMLENELNGYLANPRGHERQIIATRGRLIRALRNEYKLEPDLTVKTAIRTEINRQIQLHANYLNNRLSRVKKSKSLLSQIPNEIGLKHRKVVNNVRAVKNANTASEKIENGARAVGNAISVVGSAAKVPLLAGATIIAKAGSTIGKIIMLPIHVPAFLFSKIINPDSKYNGKTITNTGASLGRGLGSLVKKAGNRIRRM